MTTPAIEFLNEQFAVAPSIDKDVDGGAAAFHEAVSESMERNASELVSMTDGAFPISRSTAHELARTAVMRGIRDGMKIANELHAQAKADALRITREMQEGK